MIRAIGDVLDLRISMDAWWQAGQVDRLIDRGHAALVEPVVRTLRDDGWTTRVEVTFNHYGERGSADVVAWHPEKRILLIVEVKTTVGDVQATASTFERKVRVLPDVLANEEGWQPAAVARLLVVAETHPNRDVIREHRSIFDAIWPARTATVRRWLRDPTVDDRGPRRGFGGIWFLPYVQTGSGLARVRTVHRIRATDP
jgi:hypothetical protein